ncbi:hypothetical protein BD770DRAFT_343460 [Pilaira anomala]|nr:hypothetical protein BD770DRAFT_343460 [Pilaira anomala]
MKLSLLFCLLVPAISAIVIQQPTRTIDSSAVLNKRQESPTAFPTARYIKRDLEDTLSLYENWANDCNYNDKDNHAKVAVSDLNQLWQTVTTTVYCGNGKLKTVTKTVTATKSSTTNKGSNDKKKNDKVKCDDKCWSTYLWHTYGWGITVAQGITGITCMLFGLYFMVFGYCSFRGTLAATGFIFFAVMTWIGLVNNEPLHGYPHNEVVYMCVSAGLGLIGAFLFIFIYGVSLYFVGGLAGFFFAVFILSWKENLVIQIEVARICFIVGMGVVLAVMIILLESYTILFCTSLIGGYLFILGLDLFIHTGLINAFLTIFDGNKNHTNVYIIKTPTIVSLAFIIVLTLGSFGWQYYWNIISKKKQFGINIEEKKADEKK